MTLVCAWVRSAGPAEELIVASDSRLTGGMTWDHGQKVFPLSRGDSVLAFAGNTFYAYPLILQALRYVEDYERAASRALPLEEFRGHLERVLTDLLRRIRDLPAGEALEIDFTLLLAGYSVDASSWRFWTSEVGQKRRLRFTTPTWVGGARGMIFLGSGAAEATATRKQALASIYRSGKRPGPLSWEPADILYKMISSNTERSVGGPIQLVKVHKHLNAMPLAVLWSESEGKKDVTLFGRPLLKYEKTTRLAWDPETHKVFKLWDYLEEPKEK